jgi:hypothetical protein
VLGICLDKKDILNMFLLIPDILFIQLDCRAPMEAGSIKAMEAPASILFSIEHL